MVAANAGYVFLIDPRFQGSNRLFVLPFADGEGRTGKDYYMPGWGVTNYDVMINGKTFLDQPVNSKSRRYDELRHLTLGQGDDYTTGALLDYKYVRDNYKIIGIDLSKQRALDTDPQAIQQINFTASVPANAWLFYDLEKPKQTVLDFSQGTVCVM